MWVRQYIHLFGGDPFSVTIYGESAGAGSVSNHMSAPRSWPFFTRAISESGGFADWLGEKELCMLTS